jgi:Protein of unknown function (DUF1761)
MTELNWLAIGVCTLLMFAGGALWHGPIFGKLWMKIHHGDKTFTKEENKELMKVMWKLMVTELIASLLMIIGLACIIIAIPEYSGVRNAFMIWLAFVLPTLTSTVIWGGDKKESMCMKIAITGSYRLLALLAIGYILSVWN